MQYILTQEEYDAMRAKQKLALDLDKQNLQALCTKIADEMPVVWRGWSDAQAKPWGCILSKSRDWYCDSCPVQKICPEQFKEWSK